MQFPVSLDCVARLIELKKQQEVVDKMMTMFMDNFEAKLYALSSEEGAIWDSICKEHSLDVETHHWTIKTTEDGSTVVVSSPKGGMQ